MERDVSDIVRDIADGKLTTNLAASEIGRDPGRLVHAFVLISERFHRVSYRAAELDDENLRLRRTSPTAVYARRCFRLALVCLLLSAVTQAIVLFR